MYLNPDAMSDNFRLKVVRWLEANGCRHHIAYEPIIVRGGVAEYTAICRKGRERAMKIRGDSYVLEGRKRLRIRVPLRAVA